MLRQASDTASTTEGDEAASAEEGDEAASTEEGDEAASTEEGDEAASTEEGDEFDKVTHYSKTGGNRPERERRPARKVSKALRAMVKLFHVAPIDFREAKHNPVTPDRRA